MNSEKKIVSLSRRLEDVTARLGLAEAYASAAYNTGCGRLEIESYERTALRHRARFNQITRALMALV
jgi:hypothetical protein